MAYGRVTKRDTAPGQVYDQIRFVIRKHPSGARAPAATAAATPVETDGRHARGVSSAVPAARRCVRHRRRRRIFGKN